MNAYSLSRDPGPLGEAFRDGRAQYVQWRRDRRSIAVINRNAVGSDEWKAWNLGWNTAPEEEDE